MNYIIILALFVVVGFSVRPVPGFIPYVVVFLALLQFFSFFDTNKKSLRVFGWLLVIAPMFRAGALSIVALSFILSRQITDDRRAENSVVLVAGFILLCFAFPFFYSFSKSLDPYFLSSFLNWGGIYDFYRFNLINDNRAFDSLLQFSGIVIACLLPFCIKNELEREEILTGVGYALGASGLVILFQSVSFPHVFSFNLDPFFSSQSRLPGTFSDPNALGIFAGLFGPYIYVFAKKNQLKWMQMSAVFFMIMAVWSGSRTYFVMLLIWLVMYAKRRTMVAGGFLLIMLAGLVVGYPPLNEKLNERIEIPGISRSLDTLHWGRSGDMLASRFIYSRLAYQVWKSEPYTGVGLGGFYERQEKAAKELGIDLNTWKDNANNFYLQILSEGGLSSVFALLVLILIIVLLARENPLPDELSKKALIVCLIALISGPHLHFDEIRYGVIILILGTLGWKGTTLDFEKPLLIAIILVGFFGSVTGYSHRDEHTHQGLYRAEKPYVWTSKRARLGLCLVGGSSSQIDIQALHPDIGRRKVEVSFTTDANNRLMKVDLHNTSWKSFDLSPLLESSNPENLYINVSRTWSPLRRGASLDARQLGVRIRPPDGVCQIP